MPLNAYGINNQIINSKSKNMNDNSLSILYFTYINTKNVTQATKIKRVLASTDRKFNPWTNNKKPFST